MIKADDIFWRQFTLILIGLSVFGFVVAFIARSIAGDAHVAQISGPASVAARIAPVGRVRTGDPTQAVAPAPAAATTVAAAPAASGGGESTYKSACSACHASGVANAPKLDDPAAWKPRIALGLDALVGSVVNGKGAMPPKGGMASLDEAQIRATVSYMLEQVGGGSPAAGAADAGKVAAVVRQVADTASSAVTQAVGTASAAASAAGAAASAVAEQAGAAAEKTAATVTAAASQATAAVAAAAGGTPGKPGAEVYNMACVACHATGVANAPKLDDKAAWETRAAAGLAALVHSAVNGKGAMPPKGGLMTLGEPDIENAVHYMLEQAGVGAGG